MFILTLLEHFIGTLLPLCIDSLWLYLFDWVTYWENVKHVYCHYCQLFLSSIIYVTIIWGAARRTETVATIVKEVKNIKHNLQIFCWTEEIFSWSDLSRTMAANFQSPDTLEQSSSSLILSVITRISLNINSSSSFTGGDMVKGSNWFLEEFLK